MSTSIDRRIVNINADHRVDRGVIGFPVMMLRAPGTTEVGHDE